MLGLGWDRLSCILPNDGSDSHPGALCVSLCHESHGRSEDSGNRAFD